MGRRIRAARACLAAALGIVLASSAGARPNAPADSAGSSGWRVIPEIEANVTYDDNVFLLGPTKKDNLNPVSSVNVTSGRYADMESAGDLIGAFRGSVDFRGSGWRGKKLTVTPEARYDIYASNLQRSHARLGLTLEQALPKAGRLRLRDRYTPSYFAKNYLGDAVDVNGDGSIASDERRYRAGTYAENEAWLDWRFPVAPAHRAHPLGATAQLSAGHYMRTYDAPFEVRDLAGPTAAAELDLDLGPHTVLQVGYDLSLLSATPGLEVLLLDEPSFGKNFNGNGNATDLNARAKETVDHSRTGHEVSLALRMQTSPKADVTLSYALRARTYGSSEPYDIANRDRHDRRHVLGASLRLAVQPHADLMLGGEISSQTTNHAGDPGATGDVSDYNSHAVFAALTYRR